MRVWREPYGLWIRYPPLWLETYINMDSKLDPIIEGHAYKRSTEIRTIDGEYREWNVLTRILSTTPVRYYWARNISEETPQR